MTYHPKNMLITGGSGFIGSHFIEYVLTQDDTVRLFNLDCLTYAGQCAPAERFSEGARYHFIHGNICDAALVDRVLRENQIDTVVHFAAESHVDRSIASPDVFMQTNLIGTFRLLEACKTYWLDELKLSQTQCRFHHISTDEVYGTLAPQAPAFEETTAYAPNSPYAASKAGADHLVRAYYETYGLPTTLSNCTNNFGPYQFPEKLIPLCITRALHGEVIPIYGDGQQVRDWLYVVDHCRGIARIVHEGTVGETYNIGGQNEWQNIELVDTLCGVIDKAFAHNEALKVAYPECPATQGISTRSLIEKVTDRLGHDRRYAINPTKIQQNLGFTCETPFEKALEETVRFYLETPNWWKNLAT